MGGRNPGDFLARQKTEVVLRLLRGEALDMVSRELGIPAVRLTTWREAFLEAGQDALKKPPLENHDRELARLRQKLGEAEMDEMWSLVGNKGNPRWLWHAIDHHTGKVLTYVFGHRKDEVFCSSKR